MKYQFTISGWGKYLPPHIETAEDLASKGCEKTFGCNIGGTIKLKGLELIFTNAFSNGRQSIEALPSILASLPSFKVPFTSSPYANQEIQSLVSVFNEKGYTTSFFHGAPNGSMGFLGLSNILKFDNYFGKNEFNDNSLYDGFWGIWDEPFLQFSKSVLDDKNEPFLATIFTHNHQDHIG